MPPPSTAPVMRAACMLPPALASAAAAALDSLIQSSAFGFHCRRTSSPMGRRRGRATPRA
eukprot:4446105-Pleurochrysis_carterae.AAC.2